MTAAPKTQKIDVLMEQASEALAATRYFEAERLAWQALGTAHGALDYERMSRILLPLQEARRQRFQLALDVGSVTVVTEPIPEDAEVEAGCYLFQPPVVGADARRFRLMGLDQEVPLAVLCREPTTQTGLCPVVAIGPGVTVRMKVHLPEDEDAPDMAWFVDTMDAIGEFAAITIDSGLAVHKRVDLLVARLETLPASEELHQAAEATCREAHLEQIEQELEGKGRKTRR